MTNETMVTLVGYVATAPVYHDYAHGGGGGVARFRLGVTPRRWDRVTETWLDGHTSFYTVWAPRALGMNVAASVSVGEPVMVRGRMKVREDDYDGRRRSAVEIDAVAVGHDLARGTTDFRRGSAARPAGVEAAHAELGSVERRPAPPEPGAETVLLPGPVPEPVPAPPF